jgi:predicted transcriptional regulator
MTVSNGKSSGERISFHAEQELREALERIAERNDRTLSAEIRRALKKHVTAEAKAAA